MAGQDQDPKWANRQHPSRRSVLVFQDNRPILLFVTVVAHQRRPVLAHDLVRDCLVAAWRTACDWQVGGYVIMPEHMHFFCAPQRRPPLDFHRWMAYWKSLSTKMYWAQTGGARPGGGPSGGPCSCANLGGSRSCATGRLGTEPTDARERVPPRNPPLWQRDCWDRQLRTGESYAQKWAYVRNNPVRRGLVDIADAWPYWGILSDLEWHDR